MFSVVPLCSIMLFIELFYTGTTSFLSLYAGSVDASEYTPWFFVAYSVTTAISRPFTGKMLDLRGDFVVMVPSMVSCALGYLLLGSVHSGFAIVFSGVLLALGRGVILGTIQTLAVMGVPPEKVGVATSTFFLFADAGSGLGPMAAGCLGSLLGGRNELLNVQGVMVLVLLVYYLCIRKAGLGGADK